MKWLQEFKTFAVRGSVVDMAVGIVIGAAFGKIVSSLVADVITPPVGLLISGIDFSSLALTEFSFNTCKVASMGICVCLTPKSPWRKCSIMPMPCVP